MNNSHELRDRLDEVKLKLEQANAMLQLLLEVAEKEALLLEKKWPGIKRASKVYIPVLWSIYDIISTASDTAKYEEEAPV